MSKRQDILDAARVLVVTTGLQAITLPKLFGLAGVGAGTTYNLFPGGLREVLNTLFSETQDLLDREIGDGSSLVGTPKERFGELCSRFLHFTLSRPHDLAVLLACGHAAAIDPVLRQRTTAAVRLVTEMISEGQSSGALRPFPAVPSYLMISGALMALSQGHHDGKYVLDESMISQAFEGLWSLLAEPEQ
jgi:AcrR family transcriptional regulator